MSAPFDVSSERFGAGTPHLLEEVVRLLRPFWRLIVISTAAGGAGGLAMAWALSIINGALLSETSTGILLGLAGLCALSLAGQLISGIGNSLLGQRIVARLRQDVSARILRAPLSQIEQMKSPRLLAVLNGDVDKIAELGNHFAGYTTAFAIIIGCLGYLFQLSVPMACFALLLALLGGVLNHFAMRQWLVRFDVARDLEDQLQRHYRAIIDGAKELRLNRARRLRLQTNGIGDTTNRIADSNGRAFAIFWAADTISIALIFVFIAAALALRPHLGIPNEAVTGFIIVMLFAKGPIEELASALPVFSQAQIAFRRISSLSASLSAGGEDGASDAPRASLRFQHSITLEAVKHSFADTGPADAFILDIPRLDIPRGEVTFIVGGNGSGKTTLIKILLGLYQPQSGRVRLDDEPISAAECEGYRQLFSSVFTDYHLFDEVMACAGGEARVNAWLQRLDLSAKVDFADGRFSTTDLSTGQRKRLAFIQAVLEDRPILMFDEWAADQDPEFRRLFYRVLLPQLRDAGKTVIAVSHDDRYFDAADRIVHMAGGRIVRIEQSSRGKSGTHAFAPVDS
ncbi:cyclic peptide export ABC transporter [Bosea sp. (in: a-proteobacteria)]|uniref:cyclic peptide export ABC transporter n=1 Tax=Bosea sp. (in: a-proteobacteria) TaxID=1871050 RepID=UPI001223C258|nr:cyclic peptide export ABC transporter [Bosea sp. (in: a-proteobacteria)]TAJ34918.1 MAG: cyclic peptide export ABC transporter [Bosea sp. (in: a-proteobacteria)]